MQIINLIAAIAFVACAVAAVDADVASAAAKKPTPKPSKQPPATKCNPNDVIGRWAAVTEEKAMIRKKPKGGKPKNVWVDVTGIFYVYMHKDGTLESKFMGHFDGQYETGDFIGNWTLPSEPDFHGSCELSLSVTSKEVWDPSDYVARLIGPDADKMVGAEVATEGDAALFFAWKAPEKCDNSTIKGSYAYPTISKAGKGYVSSLPMEYWDGEGNIEGLGEYSIEDNCIIEIPGSNYVAIAHDNGLVYTNIAGALDIGNSDYLHTE